MKKILVTGATGFIGNYVVNELLANNFLVIATSSNEEKAKQASWYAGVTYIPFNFVDYNSSINYHHFFGEPDLVIHLAWEGLPNYKETFHLTENLPRHLALLANMIKNGLRDLTVTGTCFEYGKTEGKLSEAMETHPANSYAQAKDELRKHLQLMCVQFQFHFKWLRLFYMYGKGQLVNSLFSQLDKALEKNEESFNMSGGAQQRDYLPVEKAATYIVKVALQQEVDGIINCCSGQPVSVKNMVENYLEEKKKAIHLNLGYYPYTDYEAMAFWGDNNKLKLVINDD